MAEEVKNINTDKRPEVKTGGGFRAVGKRVWSRRGKDQHRHDFTDL